jgi:arylformamidase
MTSESNIFLSYTLSNTLSGYGNGKRVELTRTNCIDCGDSSNNTELTLPAHFGTHMDFPYHFDDLGKLGENYPASFFIFNNTQLINIEMSSNETILIDESHFKDINLNANTELLIIKTNFCHYREQECYWKSGPGFQPEVAKFLKKKMPDLRVVGFDFISITSYQHRALGKVAHKAFLIEEDLLVIEDMDLRQLKMSSKIEKTIVSPLRYDTTDGSPVTIIATVQ